MKKIDVALGIMFWLVGMTLGISVLLQSGSLFFYQTFTPELVYSACGYGFGHPDIVPAPLLAFLFRETVTFNCSDLDPHANLNAPGLFSLSQFYFSLATALLWRISSVSYQNLWPLVGVLTGLYAAGCFVLLRQFFSRLLATIGAGLLTTSPVTLPIVVLFRDYSKAAFFIWAIAFMLLALQSRQFAALIGWTAASALAIGIGAGFRADIIILLPVGVLTLVIVFNRKLFLRRLMAAAVMVAVTVAAAFPILSNGKGGTYGSLIMQGMSEPFRLYLKMDPAPYSFGARYSDELVLSSVAADARNDHPDWDMNEGKPVYGVSQATILSGANWQRFFPLFVGDFATQAFKSAGFIVGFPILAADNAAPDPGYPVMQGPPISIWMAPVYSLIAQLWSPWLGLAGLYMFFWTIWSRSRQDAIALGFLFGCLATYPVAQFSIRHVFHLEFIWICALLAILNFPAVFGVIKRSGWSYAAVVATFSVLALSAYMVALQRQERLLRREFEMLLAQPRELISQQSSVAENSPIRFDVPVPASYEQLVASPADSMTPAIASVGIQWDVRSSADRLLLTFSGSGCVGQISLSLVYKKRDDVWQPFDERMKIELDGAGEGTHVLIPSFYRPTQYLSSLSLDQLPLLCSASLERIQGNTVFPALMTAILSPGWRHRALRVGFGEF